MLPQAARKMWAGDQGIPPDAQPNFLSSMLNASGFAPPGAPQMDPTLLRYLSQQVSQVRSVASSDTDYQRMSKSSINSMANSSAITGMSPGGMSPTSSLAGPQLECQTLSNNTSNHSPTSTAAFNPDPRLGRVSDLTSLSCASPTLVTQLSPNEGSAASSAEANTSEAGSTTLPGQINSCPSSIVVTATTDATHAAGLVNFSLSQAGITSFVLVAPLGPASSPGSQATLCAALRVAITARRIHQATAPPTDLAVMPVFSTMPMTKADSNGTGPQNNHYTGEAMVECVNVHVYQVSAGLAPQSGSAQQLRIDLGAPPMLLAMQLTQGVLGKVPSGDGSMLQPMEVMFGPAATRTALHVLTHAHCQLASMGHEALLLPSQAEGGTSTSHFSVFMVPAPSAPQQVHAATRIAMEAQVMQAQAMQQLLALGHSSDNMGLYPGADSAAAMLQPNFASRSAPQGNFPGLPPGMNLNPGMTAGPNMNPYQMLGVMSGQQRPNPNMNAAAIGWQHGLQKAFSLPFGGLDMNVLEAANAAAAVAASNGAVAQLNAAAAAQQLQQQAVANSSSGGGNGGSASVRLRARKADWVIVTEDTAIKNAAGAVAKVLSRMAVQGWCCPVFMERKTARYTGVVSVAVKAIAVARGYVHNEGSGHEVGFQPYIRGHASACSFGAARPPGAPAMSAADAARSEQLSTQLLSSLAAGDLAALELLRMGGSPPLGMSPRANSSSLRGSSPPLMGGSPTGWSAAELARGSIELNGGSGSSSVCGEDDAGGQWSDLEQAELAFDVYKVMLQHEVPEGNSQPVKVTAHSRPGVVSSIISKLVLERQSAVLITAGGRAMHVAMLAVVVARQRLQAQGVDILLLPKFITVDTTSTLGWESVFLKFSIIKWSAAASLAAEMSSKLVLNRTSTQ